MRVVKYKKSFCFKSQKIFHVLTPMFVKKVLRKSVASENCPFGKSPTEKIPQGKLPLQKIALLMAFFLIVDHITF